MNWAHKIKMDESCTGNATTEQTCQNEKRKNDYYYFFVQLLAVFNSGAEY